MLLSITKIELKSRSKLIAFFKFNRKIIEDLKKSKCKQFKMSGSLNLKEWYTMTLWENETDLINFYRAGTHLEAMKVSKTFSTKIKSHRIAREVLIKWKEAKKLFI